MTVHVTKRRARHARAQDTAELIDALMAAPPAPRPAITVVGDEAVFAITPADAARSFGPARRSPRAR